jgi:hypothetical protein
VLRLEFNGRVLQGYSQGTHRGTQQGYSGGYSQRYSAGYSYGVLTGVLDRGFRQVFSQGTQQAYHTGLLDRCTLSDAQAQACLAIAADDDEFFDARDDGGDSDTQVGEYCASTLRVRGITL